MIVMHNLPGAIFITETRTHKEQNQMSATISWNDLQIAFKVQGLEEDTIEALNDTVRTVQGLQFAEEVKLCRNLVVDDQGKTVYLNDRKLTGVLYDFNEDEHGNFWLSIDFKIHKFKPESLIVLQKSYTGADTLVEA